MYSKPTTRSASKSKGTSSAHEANELDSPTPKASIRNRRRKSAPSVVDPELTETTVGHADGKHAVGKGESKPVRVSGRDLGLSVEGLKEKIGKGLEDLTIQLKPKVRYDTRRLAAHPLIRFLVACD